MRLRELIILSTCLLIAADEPKSAPAPDDMQKIQGGWYETDFEMEGVKPVQIVSGPEFDLAFKKDKIVLNGTTKGYFRIDPTKNPPTIDMQVTIFGVPVGKPEVGIYKLEEGKLTICSTSAPAPRPTSFTSPKGKKWRLAYYSRKPNPRGF